MLCQAQDLVRLDTDSQRRACHHKIPFDILRLVRPVLHQKLTCENSELDEFRKDRRTIRKVSSVLVTPKAVRFEESKRVKCDQK